MNLSTTTNLFKSLKSCISEIKEIYNCYEKDQWFFWLIIKKVKEVHSRTKKRSCKTYFAEDGKSEDEI